jgi:hypothetical protein
MAERQSDDREGCGRPPGRRSADPDSPSRRRFRRWLLAQLLFLCLALLAFLLSLAFRGRPEAVAILRGANIGFGITAVICGAKRRRSSQGDPPAR